MKIVFIGSESLANDGGVQFPAKLDGRDLLCHFSYEALDDIELDVVLGDELEHFSKYQLKLLTIAEQKILTGGDYAGQIQVFSNDLPFI